MTIPTENPINIQLIGKTYLCCFCTENTMKMEILRCVLSCENCNKSITKYNYIDNNFLEYEGGEVPSYRRCTTEELHTLIDKQTLIDKLEKEAEEEGIVEIDIKVREPELPRFNSPGYGRIWGRS